MIHDISQPVFGCCVYPGDSRPEKTLVSSIDEGALCNLTDISMCVHNGTHVDAPLHFFRDGRGIGRIALEKFIGPAFVAHHEGDLTARDAAALLARAASLSAEAARKILLAETRPSPRGRRRSSRKPASISSATNRSPWDR